jgi:hypothetical protein
MYPRVDRSCPAALALYKKLQLKRFSNLKLSAQELVTTMDTLYLHGHPLPSDLDIFEIHRQAALDHAFVYGNRNTSRLVIGNFLSDVWASLNSGPKFTLYSAHDTTLLPILGLLTPPGPGQGLEHPPCASSLVLELYRDTKGREHVGVIFNSRPLELSGLKHSTGSLYWQEDLRLLFQTLSLTDEQAKVLCHQF